MILTPLYLAAMLIEFRYHYFVALVIFAVASITDFLDGKIARKHNLITTFGKLCDPVADKMLTTAALLAFMQLGLCDIWVVMIILTREFLVTSLPICFICAGRRYSCVNTRKNQNRQPVGLLDYYNARTVFGRVCFA